MLNEPASSMKDTPLAQTAAGDFPDDLRSELRDELRELVSQVFAIENITFHTNPDAAWESGILMPGGEVRLLASFEGRLTVDSEAAYDLLDRKLAPSNRLPVFREMEQKRAGDDRRSQVINILEGRIVPKPRPWWPNLVLFIATFLSVLSVGAAAEVRSFDALLEDPAALRHGLPYALAILLILGAHELGHYFAARHHRVAVTLPYFIPLPFSLFGTMGAFIQLRQPMRNRRVLMDVGAAGPLAGLAFAIPILIFGLLTSDVERIRTVGLTEGNSLLYAAIKFVIFGRFLPGGGEDVFLNQWALAGWTGLLVTSLNLIPIGQLDGGHILYSILGDRARKLYYPLLLSLVGLALFVRTWLIWVFLLMLFGRIHATPLDNITALDRPRRWIALLSLAIFMVIFVPIPFSVSGPARDLPRPENTVERSLPVDVAASLPSLKLGD